MPSEHTAVSGLEQRAPWGVIGGTGLSALEGLADVEQVETDTPYGPTSGPITLGSLGDTRLAFLPRHGAEHTIAPHRINYRANVWALARKAERVIAVAAVGGIRATFLPGELVIVDQLIDYTWGREHTYFDEPGNLSHIDFTEPYDPAVRCALLAAAANADVQAHDRGVYGATQGPRLETPAEIDRMERDGCDVVGMTGMPEAALARELDLPYATCSVVVNPAAGRGHGEITMALIRRHLETGMRSVHAMLKALAMPADGGRSA